MVFSPDALAGHPGHAASLGRIVSSFSLIEGALGGIYGILPNKSSYDALDELKKLPTNVVRVRAVKAQIAKSSPLATDTNLTSLMDRILSFAERRNKVTHGVWGVGCGVWGVWRSDADRGYRIPVKKWLVFVAQVAPSSMNGVIENDIDVLRTYVEEYDLGVLMALKAEASALCEDTLEAFTKLAMFSAMSGG